MVPGMDWISFFSMQGVAALSALFIFVIGCAALLVVILFIIDLSQTRDAIRHNFPVIGRFRSLFSRLGEASISPNRHPEISNFSELLDFINLVRDLSGKPVGFKTVVGAHTWLEEMCEKIHQCGIACAPDFVTIDGGDGGTGAAPMPLMDSVGLPIKAALPKVVDILQRYGLRDRIKVIASGKLITPSETAWAFCVGADFVTSARGFMLAIGCIQALKCNRNTCPTGITTHNKRLQRGLNPQQKALRIKNFVDKIHYGSGLIAHSCGVPHPRALRRHHCQIIQANTQPIPLDELYPTQQTAALYRTDL